MTDREPLDPADLEAGPPQDAFTARLKRAAQDVDQRAPQDLALRVLDAVEAEVETLVAPGGSWSEPWWETVRRSPWMRLAAASLALHLFGVPVLAYVLWWSKDDEPQLNLSFVPPQAEAFDEVQDDVLPAPLPEVSPEELEAWERGANRRRLDELRLDELLAPPSIGVRTELEGWVAARLDERATPLGTSEPESARQQTLTWLAEREWHLDHLARGHADADVDAAELARWRAEFEALCSAGDGAPWVGACELLFRRIERRAQRYAGLSAEGQPPHDELWDPRGWLRSAAPLLEAGQREREPWLSWLRWARE
ncbi:MAG: hypothetical protein ACYS26_18240 [Planctomycetota bacterium]|jgi:hypothetical protein